MEISKRARMDGTLVLVLAGEFDIAAAPEVRRVGLDLIAADGCSRVPLDMMDVSFLDSTGIGALIGLRLAAEEANIPFALVDPSDRVTRLFELTRLTQVFTVERLDT